MSYTLRERASWARSKMRDGDGVLEPLTCEIKLQYTESGTLPVVRSDVVGWADAEVEDLVYFWRLASVKGTLGMLERYSPQDRRFLVLEVPSNPFDRTARHWVELDSLVLWLHPDLYDVDRKDLILAQVQWSRLMATATVAYLAAQPMLSLAVLRRRLVLHTTRTAAFSSLTQVSS